MRMRATSAIFAIRPFHSARTPRRSVRRFVCEMLARGFSNEPGPRVRTSTTTTRSRFFATRSSSSEPMRRFRQRITNPFASNRSAASSSAARPTLVVVLRIAALLVGDEAIALRAGGVLVVLGVVLDAVRAGQAFVALADRRDQRTTREPIGTIAERLIARLVAVDVGAAARAVDGLVGRAIDALRRDER